MLFVKNEVDPVLLAGSKFFRGKSCSLRLNKSHMSFYELNLLLKKD